MLVGGGFGRRRRSDFVSTRDGQSADPAVVLARA
jgi:hypothetical protein